MSEDLLQQLLVGQARQTTQLEDHGLRLGGLKSDFRRLDDAIRGNGDTGIHTRLDRLEQRTGVSKARLALIAVSLTALSSCIAAAISAL